MLIKECLIEAPAVADARVMPAASSKTGLPAECASRRPGLIDLRKRRSMPAARTAIRDILGSS
jgi:hypothetical protein